MDPAVAALDFAKAGAILANMIESYLAAGASLSELEEPEDDDDIQDLRTASVTASLHLHSPVDDGASPFQSGEHGTPIQSGQQGRGPWLEHGADPHPRPRSRPVGGAHDQSRGLQDFSWRCGDGPSGGDLLLGSFTPGALEPGLASLTRAVRDHRYPRDRLMLTPP